VTRDGRPDVEHPVASDRHATPSIKSMNTPAFATCYAYRSWPSSIGSSLIAVAKRQRPGGLKLWTFEANSRARRFYERHGFVVTGGTDGGNEEGAPDVRYEWRPCASSDT
jgi:hypothetical protein